MQEAQSVVRPAVNWLQVVMQVLRLLESGQKHVVLVQRLCVHSCMTRQAGDFLSAFSCFGLQASAFSRSVHACEVATVAAQSDAMEVHTPRGVTFTDASAPHDTVPVPFADSAAQSWVRSARERSTSFVDGPYPAEPDEPSCCCGCSSTRHQRDDHRRIRHARHETHARL